MGMKNVQKASDLSQHRLSTLNNASDKQSQGVQAIALRQQAKYDEWQ
jgi:hypothetical protein